MKRIHMLVSFMILSASILKAQTPLEFNNTLTAITDSLYRKGQAWGNSFNTAHQNGNYAILKPITKDMIAFIDKNIVFVQKMKDVNNSKPLRLAVIDFLNYEKQLVEVFKTFEAFDAATPKEKVQDALNIVRQKAKDEGTSIQKLQAVQEKYAAENGFKIGE